MVVRRSCQRSPSDVTATEWTLIESQLRAQPGLGRPRELDIRAVLNALRSINRTGWQWEHLPKDFPNQNSVGYDFDRWTGDGPGVKSTDAV